MNPKEKQKFKHDRQVFNEKNSKFIVYLEKTFAKSMTVSAAIKELGIKSAKWYELKKQYSKFNGLNS